MPLNEITLNELSIFYKLVNIKILEKAIFNSVKNNYEYLSSENKDIIFQIIHKENSIHSWRLLLEIFKDEELIGNYIDDYINPLSDCDKIKFIREKYNKTLLHSILTNWTTKEKNSILNLAASIGKKNQVDLIPNVFMDIIKSLEWTFEEALHIYSVFEVQEIAENATGKYSFIPDNYALNLKQLLPINTLTKSKIDKLRTNLLSEINAISAERVLDIFSNLKDYGIIKNESHLLELIKNKILPYRSLSVLISHLANQCPINVLMKGRSGPHCSDRK